MTISDLPLENGMLLGAAAEWERLNRPVDLPADEDLVDFICDIGCVPEALAGYLGVTHLDEAAALDLFDELPASAAARIVRSYFGGRNRCNACYLAWKEGDPCDR